MTSIERIVISRLLPVLLLSACQEMEDGTETGSSAALGTPKWVASDTTNNVSEPYSFPVKVESTWEMVNVFNFVGSGSTIRYTCSRDGGASWSQKEVNFPGVPPSHCCDNTGFFRSAFRAPFKAYVVGLSGSPVGGTITWYRSPDPCPASGTPTWDIADHDLSASIVGSDYPYSFYNPTTDGVFATWEGTSVATGKRTFFIGKLQNDKTLTFNAMNCPTDNAAIGGGVNAAVDSVGTIHAIFHDGHFVKHIAASSQGIFNNCDISIVGPHDSQTSNLTIAIDRSVTPNTLVVAYPEAGTGACASNIETRFFRSVDSGATWTQTKVTTCETNEHPRATAVFTPTLPAQSGRFHVVTRVKDTATTFRQKDWKSTNGGLTWTSSFLTGQRPADALPSGDDYGGATADLSRNRMFYTWGQRNTTTGRFAIRGITNDP